MIQSDRAPGCLSTETLAAFLDGRLTTAERSAVEAHLATCADCYELWSEAGALLQAVPSTRAVAPRPTLVPRPRILMAAVLGLAALIAVVLFPPDRLVTMWRPDARPELGRLVAAIRDDRPIEARLTGGFAWGPVPSATRGPRIQSDLRPEIQIATARLKQRLDSSRSPRSLAAFGTARLVTNQPDEAATSLEEAVALSPDLAFAWSDLAAAYLARSRDAGHAGDVPRALEAAEHALRLRPDLPEALFNRALAVESLHLRTDANLGVAQLHFT